jgi:hypothetical protein
MAGIVQADEVTGAHRKTSKTTKLRGSAGTRVVRTRRVTAARKLKSCL